MLGKVLSVRRLRPDVCDMRLLAGLQGSAPGRFVHLALPGLMLRRPVSLCGFEDGIARLVFAVKGQGTLYLSRLVPGDSVDLLGPLGNCFPCPENSDDPVLLAGGGIGLPPLLYFAKAYPGRSYAVSAFRTKEDIVLADEFPAGEICTDDGSSGFHGFLHERLAQVLQENKFSKALICGPAPMMRAAAAACREADVPCFASLEERMGCGIGACMVCACMVGGMYRRSCKDGPIFSAEEVDWE
ncbi:MAG: dihydroorotate dehydrogenase electron transfer subunit [Oscillospiraceae bacterium]|nr:dihydroorotate dehydrogenase electron transfer subunit [Oscillospiraceae bacterium]